MRIPVTLALAVLHGSLGLADPGRLDPSFAPTQAPNGPVRDLMVLPDGDIITAGEFTQVGTVSQAYIAKFHPDGCFDNVNGTVAHGLVRLDANGAIDSTFDAGLGPRYASGNVVGIADWTMEAPDGTSGPTGFFRFELTP